MADSKTRLQHGIFPIRNGTFGITLIAAGAINPDRFVYVDSNGKAAQAGASAINVVGVYNGHKAAAAGDKVWIDTCNITTVEGDGSVAAGDLIASDTNGRAVTVAGATGVTTVATGWLILGVALETDGSAGDTILVKLFR